MNIIQKQPNQSGAYPSIQSWSGAVPPDGYYEITADTSEFYNGFIIPTVKNGVITSFVCNAKAWEAWKATQPQPLTELEKARKDALNRIDGKCSGAIASGVTVGSKHYKLTPTAQSNLATAQAKVDGGAASVIYAADGEEPTLHTAAQITALSDAAYKWGVVNTSYYAKLKAWIARETDTAVLNAIDYGTQLPTDLMQELTDLLTSAGIDVTKYMGLFTGGNK